MYSLVRREWLAWVGDVVVGVGNLSDVGDVGRAPSVDHPSARRDACIREKMTGLAREDGVIGQEGEHSSGAHARGG